MSRDESWHLSKSVPISLFITLVVQVGAFLWIIASMDSQITVNKEDIEDLKQVVDTHSVKQNSVDVKLGRIDENVKANRRTLEKIESLVSER